MLMISGSTQEKINQKQPYVKVSDDGFYRYSAFTSCQLKKSTLHFLPFMH